MKTNLALAKVACTLLLLASVRLQAAEGWVRYEAQPGSKMKIDGTSTIHDWTVESKLIGGYVEFDPAFDLENPKPGNVNARTSVRILIRQLKSDKTAMDNVMYDAMKQKEHPRIEYKLSEMTLKAAPKSRTDPVVFDTKGELTVSGVTNKISMPVTMQRVDQSKLKFSGSASVKMTSFGIQPPSPPLLGSVIKTGDDVKITFEWLTAKRGETAK